MKKIWKIAGIATLVAVVGIIAVGVVAFAQEGGDEANWPFNFQERMHQAIANALGISVEEYDAAVETARQQVLDDAVAEGWLTEDQAARMRERMEEGQAGFGPRGRQLRGLAGRSFLVTAAETLDMTPQDLLAELREGKSIADVAAEQGVDPQTIVDAALDKLRERLDEAVAEGKLTQARADWMLSQAKTHLGEALDKTWEGQQPGGFRPGKRPMRPGVQPGGFQGGGPNQGNP